MVQCKKRDVHESDAHVKSGQELGDVPVGEHLVLAVGEDDAADGLSPPAARHDQRLVRSRQRVRQLRRDTMRFYIVPCFHVPFNEA